MYVILPILFFASLTIVGLTAKAKGIDPHYVLLGVDDRREATPMSVSLAVATVICIAMLVADSPPESAQHQAGWAIGLVYIGWCAAARLRDQK